MLIFFSLFVFSTYESTLTIDDTVASISLRPRSDNTDMKKVFWFFELTLIHLFHIFMAIRSRTMNVLWGTDKF